MDAAILSKHKLVSKTLRPNGVKFVGKAQGSEMNKLRCFGQSIWLFREDIFARKPLAKQSLGRTGVNGKIIINPREAGCKNESWMEMAQCYIN